MTGGIQELKVVVFAQLPRDILKGFALQFQKFQAAILPAEETKQAVDSGELCVDGSRCLPLIQQVCLPLREGNAGGFPPAPPPGALPLDPSSFFLERKKEPKKELCPQCALRIAIK